MGNELNQRFLRGGAGPASIFALRSNWRLAVPLVASVWQGSRVGIRFSPANAGDGIAHTDRFGPFANVIRELNRFHLAYIHLIEPRVAGNAEAAQFDAALNSRISNR